MKKIIISLSVIAAAAAIVIGGTTAFFSDTETSTGNTFTAGSIDLKVDNTCHFNGGSCPEHEGIVTTWTENDLGAIHKFFYFTDLKPGDFGEDTVSLHVHDNDAWGRLIIDNLTDSDNGCTEPELEAEQGCTPTGDGELRENLSFWVWLDQGETPGFQGKSDTGEGDNIRQEAYEPMLITPGPIDAGGETWNLWEGLAAAYQGSDYGQYGMYLDGRMVGSVTYYFGIGWELPTDVGNDVQSDTFVGDMILQVVQHRNNIDSAGGPISW